MRKILLFISGIVVALSAHCQSKIGLEISYFGGSTAVDVPGVLKGQFDKVEPGSASFLSLGFTIKASDKITVKGGYRSWTWGFSPVMKGTYNNQDALAHETGNLKYSGIYFRIDRTIPYFYFSGGFDISFSNSFKGDLVINSTSGAVLFSESNRTRSIAANDFYNQFNLILGLGPSIPIGKHLKLKGNISGVIPFSSVYDSGVVVKQVYISNGAPAPDANANLFYVPFISYGIGVEYFFGTN